MNRFVIISFLFMGWAFYELSGGADFEPPKRPTDMAQAEGDGPVPRSSKLPQPPDTQTPQLTRREEPVPEPVEALISRQDVVSTASEPQDTPQQEEERIVIRFGETPLPPADPNNPGMLVSLEQSPSQFATPLSLFDPNAEPEPEPVQAVAAPTPEPEEPEPDVREISGTRVNMRDGPGTIYPVITRLRLGQEVEVLDESGTGWLRLRVMPGSQLGWVAASLVSKP